ncbi:MAG: PhoX family phosphatase [Pseudomonadota bacterium]
MNKPVDLGTGVVEENQESTLRGTTAREVVSRKMFENFNGDNADIHDTIEEIPTNPSTTRPFGDVLEANLSRRGMLQGSLALAVAAFLKPEDVLASRGTTSSAGGLCNFDPVTIEKFAAESNGATIPVISDDYEYDVLIPWGTPLIEGVPEYAGDPNSRPFWTEQEQQVGIGHDGMWLFPDVDPTDRRKLSNSAGVLCINHEFGRNSHVLGKSFPESLDDVRLSQSAHGVSVVRVEQGEDGKWGVRFDPRNRRITVNTPVEFSGPVAGSEYLENAASNEPLGTVNNCGNGYTPWGTYLTCEENFNGYFGSNDPTFEPLNEKQSRYGFNGDGFGYGWFTQDPRFELDNPEYANEYNRFGWIVEIDPQNPDKKPVKHTALGCFKHEAIAIRIDRGRVVCYMGDDQRFDYSYKFVSSQPWRRAVAQGRSPLEEGTLYVARFDDDGTGEWLELSMRIPALAERFSSMAELLVNTRIAADIVGATPMDRPEWTTIASDSKSVFWTLTNNSQREEPNSANPQAPNSDGHIIRTRDRLLSNTFDWEFFILCSETRGTEGVFTDPDAAYADRDGRLFIGTDGGQQDGLQDQLTVFDTTEPLAPGETPTPKRLFVGVNSDEITGWAQSPDQTTVMINMQHPGNGLPDRTNFPAPTDGVTIPRDCTIVIRKKDGGVVGS